MGDALRQSVAGARRIEALAKAGCERILLLPLYPQYAAATSATVCDAAFLTLTKLRDQPALRVVPPYYDEPVYIEALANSIEAELKRLPFKPELILASFHGIPKSYVEEGDPYPTHCAETVRLLRERMKLDETKLMLTFQSRFGRAEWLQPYTDKTVEALAQRGVKNLAVVTPGFSADCLETLEEIAVENADIFRPTAARISPRSRASTTARTGMAVISHARAARAARLDLRAANAPALLGGLSCRRHRLLIAARVSSRRSPRPALVAGRAPGP